MASKYRIHEMAKDFGMQSKRIMDMLGDIGIIPKNHMQVLEPYQLNYLFDRLTAQNQTADIQSALAAQAALPPKTKPAAPKNAKNAKAAPKAEEVKTESAKAEAPKAEEAKTEAAKAEAPKAEKAKTEAAKAEAPKAEEAKTEAAKAEAPKAEEIKTESAKAEAPKAEEAKTGAAKAEALKAEEAKAASAKKEDSKADSAKKTEPKNESGKKDAPKADGQRKGQGQNQRQGGNSASKQNQKQNGQQNAQNGNAQNHSKSNDRNQRQQNGQKQEQKQNQNAKQQNQTQNQNPSAVQNVSKPKTESVSAAQPSAEVSKPAAVAPNTQNTEQKAEATAAPQNGNTGNSSNSAANRGESRRQRFQTPVQQPQKPKKVEQQKRIEQPRANTITLQGRSDDNGPVVMSDTSEKTKGHKIDTRGESVNLERYDDRIDKFVPDALSGNDASKQKLTKKNTDRKQNVSAKKRQEEADKLKKLRQEMLKKQVLKVMIPDEIAVGELASRLKKTASDVIKQLMKLGIMASISQFIDYDTAALVAMELGAKVEHEVIVTIEDRLIDDSEDKEDSLVSRDPVVVVMGHVDHGKTSLLDHIRKAHVAAGEAGGITQHIGAYRVNVNDRNITFIDTPGHEAFTAMRARGASVTDVVILVVAADDGIMPQTIEAINHAKAAGAPIVVAINKIDKQNAQPDRVLQQLTEYGLVPEQWGGDTICCPISALKGEGIENLLEMVILTADMLDLKANPERSAKGTVIEARLDRGRGPVATVLVQNGTLHSGDVIIAGKTVGRVRVMNDENSRKLEEAGPSIPVELVGLSEVPTAGDLFYAVEDERMARELVEQRKDTEKEEAAAQVQRVSLDSLFDYIKEGEMKELNIIVKADVNGTAEAVKASLEKLTNEEVRVRVIHAGVGAINESDVMLANASNAIIVGFNVRPSQAASDAAELAKVDIRMYRVIYDCLEEMEAAMKGMLAPKFHEVILGRVQVRQVYKISSIGTIAGCYVQSGKVTRTAKVRVVRDGIVIQECDIASLKRFKDDAREVAQGYECGIGLERYNDIKVDDIFEIFSMEEIPQ